MMNNHHQLIDNQNSYFLERKTITVHSGDRDVSKWQYSNHFEITLPRPLKNVQAIRLLDWSMCGSLPAFSDEYQNTVLRFSVGAATYDAKISRGVYTVAQLCTELKNAMNAVSGQMFVVSYNEVTRKFVFLNASDSFQILAGAKIAYMPLQCEQKPSVFEDSTLWGLPYNLGFEKSTYSSTLKTNYKFSYADSPIISGNSYVVEAPGEANLGLCEPIYIEMDKHNNLDEINGNVAFAKIFPNKAYYIDDANQNISVATLPIERVHKLKFKFRYHDGRLVDFGSLPFNFTVALFTFLPEQERRYRLRVPESYGAL